VAVQNGVSLRGYRAGFGIFLASQGVVFTTLISARYITASGHIGFYSEALGAITTALMLISGISGRTARSAIKGGNLAAMDARLGAGLWFGILGVLSILLQWVLLAHMNVPVTAPTSEVYYALTGVWLLYSLIGLFVLFATRARGRRVGYTADNYWDAEAGTLLWEFVVIAWVVMYLVLYIL